MTVIDQAENAQGLVSAARLRERWGQAAVKTSDQEQIAAYGEAISTLEARFPELEDIPPGGAEAFARERGHGSGARSPSHEGRSRPGAKARAHSAPKPAPSSSSASPPSAPTVPTPAPRAARAANRARGRGDRGASRAARRASRLYGQTGIPSAGTTMTQIAMTALGGTVGLGAAYLLLTSAERPGSGGYALPIALKATTDFVRRFVSTQDILGAPAPAVPLGRNFTDPYGPGVGAQGPVDAAHPKSFGNPNYIPPRKRRKRAKR